VNIRESEQIGMYRSLVRQLREAEAAVQRAKDDLDASNRTRAALRLKENEQGASAD
jgi:hypothetical protein